MLLHPSVIGTTDIACEVSSVLGKFSFLCWSLVASRISSADPRDGGGAVKVFVMKTLVNEVL